MKTNEILQGINDLKFTFDQLDDPEFREEQGLTPKDIEIIKKEFEEQIVANRKAIEEKVDFVLQLRRKKLGYIAGNNQEIQTLNMANEAHKKEIVNLDRYIFRICKAMNADTKNKLSVQNGVVHLKKKTKKIEIDEKRLPYDMFRIKGLKTSLNAIDDHEKIYDITYKNNNIRMTILLDIDSLNDETKNSLLDKGIITEEILLKKEQRTQKEIQERYDNLSEEEKKKYEGVIKIIDDEFELKIDEMKA